MFPLQLPLHPDQARTIPPMKYDSRRDLYYIEDSVEENMPEKKEKISSDHFSLLKVFTEAFVKKDDKYINIYWQQLPFYSWIEIFIDPDYLQQIIVHFKEHYGKCINKRKITWSDNLIDVVCIWNGRQITMEHHIAKYDNNGELVSYFIDDEPSSIENTHRFGYMSTILPLKLDPLTYVQNIITPIESSHNKDQCLLSTKLNTTNL